MLNLLISSLCQPSLLLHLQRALLQNNSVLTEFILQTEEFKDIFQETHFLFYFFNTKILRSKTGNKKM